MELKDVVILDQTWTPARVAPEMAGYFLESLTYPLQRRLIPNNMKVLVPAMEARVLDPSNELIHCTSRDTGKKHQLDGFHRCTASVRYGHSFDTVIRHITVSTEAEKECLWEHFDAGGAIRTARDFQAKFLTSGGGLGRSQLIKLERACPYIAHGFSAACISSFTTARMLPRQRIEMMEKYQSYAEKYFSAIKGAHREMDSSLRGGFPIAFAVIVIENCPERAVPFYETMVANDGLRKKDPRRLFHDLHMTKKAFAREPLKQAHRMTYCWNSYYAGEDRETFSNLTEGLILPIKGTIYRVGG